VKFINTDGMAFIGPGSEWFWTALTGLILAGTFIAIYRQLRIARSAAATAQLDSFSQQWESERIIRYRLDVLVAVRDRAKPEDLPLGAAVALANFWDSVAGLTRRGHVDRELLWTEYGSVCESWWVTLAPFIKHFRAHEDNPSVWRQFEWLAELLPKLDQEGGRPTFPATWTQAALDRRIAICRDLIRVEEALRTVPLARSQRRLDAKRSAGA
jgi:hypothetical protein